MFNNKVANATNVSSENGSVSCASVSCASESADITTIEETTSAEETTTEETKIAEATEDMIDPDIFDNYPRHLDISYFRFMFNNKVSIITNLDVENSGIPKTKISKLPYPKNTKIDTKTPSCMNVCDGRHHQIQLLLLLHVQIHLI